MGIESNQSEGRTSNWTAATGTRPGERHVYPPAPPGDRSQPAARAVIVRRLRKAVAVSSWTGESSAFDALLTPVNADVVFVESTARAYSRIRSELPDVVLLCVDIDDIAAFHVLSMLKADNVTAVIPVITYITSPHPAVANGQVTERNQDTSTSTAAAPLMN